MPMMQMPDAHSALEVQGASTGSPPSGMIASVAASIAASPGVLLSGVPLSTGAPVSLLPVSGGVVSLGAVSRVLVSAATLVSGGAPESMVSPPVVQPAPRAALNSAARTIR